jgi:hypothetical protein
MRGETKPLMNMAIGDQIELILILRNHDRISGNITFITQISDDRGIAESIQESRVSISRNTEVIKMVNIWTPELPGIKFIDNFLLGIDGIDSSRPMFFPLIDKGNRAVTIGSEEYYESHNLQVETELDKPWVFAGNDLKGSMYLVNNANHAERIRLERFDPWLSSKGVGPAEPTLDSYCDAWYADELYDSMTLPVNGRIKLNQGDTIPLPWTLDHADTYLLGYYIKISIQESDRANCLYVPSNVVTFDVIPPAYDGVRLVFSTDKELYNRNETVRFEAFIENNSNSPLQLSDESIWIHILDSEQGTRLVWAQETADTRTVVEPHSSYTLDGTMLYGEPWFWEWDQRIYSEDFIPVAVEPKKYLAYATFSSPPMKSDVVPIVIQ